MWWRRVSRGIAGQLPNFVNFSFFNEIFFTTSGGGPLLRRPVMDTVHAVHPLNPALATSFKRSENFSFSTTINCPNDGRDS